MEQLSGGLLSCHPVNKTISTKTIFDCLRFTMNFHDDRDKTEHIQTPQKLNINKTSTNRTNYATTNNESIFKLDESKFQISSKQCHDNI